MQSHRSASTTQWVSGTIRSVDEPRDPKTEESEARTEPGRQARGLGWFAVGLGLAQLLAPVPLARLVGAPTGEGVRRTLAWMGLREIASGVGLLRSPRKDSWLWGRVAGDALDLALLGGVLGRRRSGWSSLVGGGRARRDRTRALWSMVAVAGITALDVWTARAHRRSDASRARRRIERTSAVTIHRSPLEVEVAWTMFREVEKVGRRSPTFTLAPGGRGTEVRLEHGPFGARLCEAKLRRFKQLVEVGEVVTAGRTRDERRSETRNERKDWLR